MKQSEKFSSNSIIYVLALAQFAAPFMYAGVGIALPDMGKELHASGVSLGLIEIIYLGAASAFLLPIGRLADLSGRVIIFKVGLAFYAFATLIIGFLSSVNAIVGVRFIQGVAAALIMSTNMAILTNAVPRKMLGRAIGINIGAVYLGLSAGPFIAGWITNQLGWRWVFHLTFIPMIFSYILIQFKFKSDWKKPQAAFDWFGSAFIVLAVFLLISGSTLMGKSIWGYLLCGSGLVAGIIFFNIENRSSHPLLSFKNIGSYPGLSNALIIQLLMYAGAFGISFLFSIYLQTVKGQTPQAAGQVMVVAPIVMAVFAPICGRLADRYPPRILATIGLISSLIGILAATRITADSHLPYLIGILIFQGLGFAMFSSPNMAIIMNSVPPSEYGIASALSANLRSLGMVLSMMIITIAMSIYLGEKMINTHTSEFLNVMQISFIVFAVLAGVGTILSLKRTAVKEST